MPLHPGASLGGRVGWLGEEPLTRAHRSGRMLSANPLLKEPAGHRRLTLPIVYNTSAYDSVESIELMDGIVDIYMPDFKYWSLERSRIYLQGGELSRGRPGVEREGCAAVLAAGGAEALALLAADGFDLVLLDLVMPEMGGDEVLRRLKADSLRIPHLGCLHTATLL